MKYKAIVFDWDGTLMDSAGKIVECMQAAARSMDIPVPSYDRAKSVIGMSLLPAVQKLFDIEEEELAKNLVENYKSQFISHQQISSPLFPGAIELLDILKGRGYLLAVATGKARKGLESAWLHSGAEGYFITSRCADDAKSKPSPDMLLQIMQELELSSRDVLMVGDTSYDMAMAEAADVDRVAVSFGVHDSNTLLQHNPLAIVDSLDDLLQFV